MTLTQLAVKYSLGNKYFKVHMFVLGKYLGVKFIKFAELNLFHSQGHVRMTDNNQIIVETI